MSCVDMQQQKRVETKKKHILEVARGLVPKYGTKLSLGILIGTHLINIMYSKLNLKTFVVFTSFS